MEENESKLKFVKYFTAMYLFLFALFSIISRNYSVLSKTLLISMILFFIFALNRKLNLPPIILAGLSIHGMLDIIGGSFYISGIRLYESWLVPNVFRYDNLVHAFGSFVFTFASCGVLESCLDKKIRNSRAALSLLLILITMGAGAFVEIMEFHSVIFLNRAKEVGDYFNNALDLVYNLIGAALACIFINCSKKVFKHYPA